MTLKSTLVCDQCGDEYPSAVVEIHWYVMPAALGGDWYERKSQDFCSWACVSAFAATRLATSVVVS